jgi:hypothetical protein
VRISSTTRRPVETATIRCLPADFPQWTVRKDGPTQAQWYVVVPSVGGPTGPYVAVFNTEGTPVWWYNAGVTPFDAKLLADGMIAFARFWFADSSHGYEVRRLDGSLERLITTVGLPTDHHDLQMADDGSAYVLAYPPRDGVDLSPYGGPANARVADGEVQEIAPDGSLEWSWSTAGHTDPSESDRWWNSILSSQIRLPVGTAYDIAHINSVDVHGNTMVVSLRHMDAVLGIDRSTGDVKWKLGGTTTDESLTVLDDPLGDHPLGGQHDARLLPDGTLTLHENGTYLGRPPRLVRYQLDLDARTATLIEQITDPEITSSFCCGGTRRLPGGDWVASWGSTGLVAEYAADGSPLLRLNFPGGVFSYRADPILPGRLRATALRRGMNAMHPYRGL